VLLGSDHFFLARAGLESIFPSVTSASSFLQSWQGLLIVFRISSLPYSQRRKPFLTVGLSIFSPFISFILIFIYPLRSINMIVGGPRFALAAQLSPYQSAALRLRLWAYPPPSFVWSTPPPPRGEYFFYNILKFLSRELSNSSPCQISENLRFINF